MRRGVRPSVPRVDAGGGGGGGASLEFPPISLITATLSPSPPLPPARTSFLPALVCLGVPQEERFPLGLCLYLVAVKGALSASTARALGASLLPRHDRPNALNPSARWACPSHYAMLLSDTPGAVGETQTPRLSPPHAVRSSE